MYNAPNNDEEEDDGRNNNSDSEEPLTTGVRLEEVAAGAKVLVDSTTSSSNSRVMVGTSDRDHHMHPNRCLVCYTDLITVAHTPCHHDEICGLCHLRLRYLHNDSKCPICKSSNEKIVVDMKASASATTKQSQPSSKVMFFEDYPIWGDDLGTAFIYNDSVGMFFPKKYFETVVQPLFGYHCLVKNCPQSTSTHDAMAMATAAATSTKSSVPTSLSQLQDHLRTVHRLTLCQLCCDHERDFVAKLPRYAPAGLQRHVTSGQGHPVCEFCRPTRFYDITALHQHLHKEHYKCHVCEQHLDMPNQFFANYRSLERHFDGQHFLCHDVQCLTARFVVFANELDLRHHERQVHGSTSGDSKLQLQFRVRRSGVPGTTANASEGPPPSEADFQYGLDGQAFVPAALPSHRQGPASSTTVPSSTPQHPQSLHPQHVQRTNELRQEAERLRSSSHLNAYSFPALADTTTTAMTNDGNSNHHRLTVGWTSHDATLQRVGRPRPPAGAVTEEDFPSLAPHPPAPKSNLGANKLSATRISTGWSSSAGVVSATTRTTT